MTWVLPMTAAAILWASHMVFIKLAVQKIAPDMLVSVFYVIALITTVSVMVINRTKFDLSAIVQDKMLAFYVVGAGVTIGLVDFFFSKGLSVMPTPPLSLYSPLFTTIGLAVTALLGVLILHESLTMLRMGGFALAVAGIFLLAR